MWCLLLDFTWNTKQWLPAKTSFLYCSSRNSLPVALGGVYWCDEMLVLINFVYSGDETSSMWYIVQLHWTGIEVLWKWGEFYDKSKNRPRNWDKHWRTHDAWCAVLCVSLFLVLFIFLTWMTITPKSPPFKVLWKQISFVHQNLLAWCYMSKPNGLLCPVWGKLFSWKRMQFGLEIESHTAALLKQSSWQLYSPRS